MKLILLIVIIGLAYLSSTRPGLFNLQSLENKAQEAVDNRIDDSINSLKDQDITEKIRSEDIQQSYEWIRDKAPEIAEKSKQVYDEKFHPTVEQAVEDIKFKLR